MAAEGICNLSPANRLVSAGEEALPKYRQDMVLNLLQALISGQLTEQAY
jgi:hypothetical protein